MSNNIHEKNDFSRLLIYKRKIKHFLALSCDFIDFRLYVVFDKMSIQLKIGDCSEWKNIVDSCYVCPHQTDTPNTATLYR